MCYWWLCKLCNGSRSKLDHILSKKAQTSMLAPCQVLSSYTALCYEIHLCMTGFFSSESTLWCDRPVLSVDAAVQMKTKKNGK